MDSPNGMNEIPKSWGVGSPYDLQPLISGITPPTGPAYAATVVNGDTQRAMGEEFAAVAWRCNPVNR